MSHAFTVTRSMHGDLRAETDLPMPGAEAGRVLHISTSKGSRGLTTRASSFVVKHERGFTTQTHNLFGDFSRVVAQADKRATEKAIREQHARVLAQADELLTEAQAFYLAKAAKEQPQAAAA